jgi:hypothetical protein
MGDWENIREVTAKPNSESRAEAQLSNDLVPRGKDLAQFDGIKALGSILWKCLFFYFAINWQHIKAFTRKVSRVDCRGS